MCGIAGFIEYNQFEGKLIDKMIKTLSSRGPNKIDSWQDKEDFIALGHSRLSIQDLSSSGDQPMISHDKKLVLVFNGEIYNHKKIRSILEKEHKIYWRGTSDTETLLESFSVYGIKKTLDLVDGMFAFAIYDRGEKVLTLGRDISGEKPLYYGFNNGVFFFGSELKCFAKHPNWIPKISNIALNQYLKYCYVPTPLSIYEDIFKLKQGHYLNFFINKRDFENPKQFWNPIKVFSNLKSNNLNLSHKEFIEKLHCQLKKSVKNKMISDVPIGVSLSGGIDSSLITSLMQSLSNNPVQTFTVGFEFSDFNEAIYAKKIAEYLGTNHTEVYLTEKDALSIIPEIPKIWDEPFSDSSQIPTLLLSRITKNKVSVSLSGDGGDELFCGYNRYNDGYKLYKLLNKIPSDLKSKFFNLIFKFPRHNLYKILKNLPLKYSDLMSKLDKVSYLADCNSGQDYYLNIISNFNDFERKNILNKEFIKDINNHKKFAFGKYDFVEEMMLNDFINYLCDDILVKVDRASMSTGLECRLPFLDKEIINTAWSCPLSFKNKNGISKWPLRQILKNYVPESYFNRPKMGFGIPISDWLKGNLKDYTNDLLSISSLRKTEFFNIDYVQNLIKDNESGKVKASYKLWNLICFQSWFFEWN